MNTARVFIWIVLISGVVYDVLATIFGWQTISAAIRETDVESGTLLRWAIVAVWLHCFLPSPWGGWSN